MADAFSMHGLRISYGRRKILDIDSAALPAGRITALVGPNGSGKTTLLECLNGLLKPDSGHVLFFGEPIDRRARRRMTLVFQNPCLFDGTVEYNVAFGLRRRRNMDISAVDAALGAVGMESFRNRRVKNLSGGEAKRVAIARALAISPEAILLDEPTANVDSENTAIIEDTIRSMCEKKGTTIVIATHSIDQAVRLSHQVLLIHEGRLVPFHPDNNFSAILAIAGSEKILRIGETLTAVVSTDKAPGPVRCAIPPEDIIVSVTPFQSSARNCWSGPLTAIALENGRVRLTVDTSGVPVVATVTRASYKTLKPAIGDTLHLTFKASSIKVY